MLREAEFSADRRYRYTLRRVWDDALPRVCFIGLNPSTADEREDDPTIRKCVGYAQRWGYGGLLVGNLFAYRATDPRELFEAADPVGRDNDRWLTLMSNQADLVIAAWGNHGTFMGRADQWNSQAEALHCLRINRTGQPAHPLYLPNDLTPRILKRNRGRMPVPVSVRSRG